MCWVCDDIAERCAWRTDPGWAERATKAARAFAHVSHTELPEHALHCSICCQTEESPEETKERALHRAPPAERTVSIGTIAASLTAQPRTPSLVSLWLISVMSYRVCSAAVAEPKEPKRAKVSWSSTGEAHANMHEILFWSLLLIRSAKTQGELDKWARDVHVEFSAAGTLKEDWKPPDTFGKYQQVSAIFAPMVDAMNATWDQAELTAIGTAMRAATWHDGQHDELDWQRLRDYLKAKPRGVRPTKAKKEGPPRWRTWSIVHVADTIKRHRATLRKLLGLDVEMEDVPTSKEVIESQEQQIQELNGQLEDKSKLLTQSRDALRKAGKRAKEAGARKTKAVRDEREKQQALRKAEREKVVARAREAKGRMQEQLQAAAEARAQRTVDQLRADLKTARARARKVENSAKLSGKRLKRAQGAEAALKELQATLEEDVEMEEAEEEEPRTRQTARRDARGRYQTMPQKLRVLIWAQLARRVAPSAIAANLFDAIKSYTPDEDVQLPCERQIMKMRGELTIASEAIAAFRVALAKRIVSFGWDESTKFGLGLLSSNTQIETAKGDIIDVVMRGAALTAGDTAEAIAWAIDRKIFSHARELLVGWKAEHEKQFGVGSWSAAGGPEPEMIGIHRLSEETLLMSDGSTDGSM